MNSQKRVYLSSVAEKSLLKVPDYIATKLLIWIDDVEERGLCEVRKVPGFHDEPLKGHLKGLRSIRLNKAYRAIYREGLHDVYIYWRLANMNTRNKGQPAKEILMKKLGRLTFGKMLRAIRLGEGETQKEFSAKLDMSKQQLSDIENDRKSVSLQSAAAYADMLGYSVDQFIKLSIQDNLAKYGLYYRVDLVPENRTNA